MKKGVMVTNPDDYALVVGINHYPNFRNLEGAIEDAQDFAKWLFDESDGGGLDSQRCQVVTSHPDPVRPIHEEIDEALFKIFDGLGNNHGRRFYLYFSGHGLGRSNLGADLCLAKWSKKWWRRAALDSLDYMKLILGSGKFGEVVFFLDCCRVREINASGLPSSLDYVRPDEIAGQGRQFIAYATEFQNSAYEAAKSNGGTGDDAVVRGHFTRALMNGLRGGAAIVTGGVPAARLKEYLELHTPRIAAEHNQKQTPEVINAFLSGKAADFGSYKPLDKINVTIRFKAGRTGVVILEGPGLEEIKREDASTSPWDLHLERGWHSLRDLTTQEEKQFRVDSPEEVSNVEF
jgi:Caspase domain